MPTGTRDLSGGRALHKTDLGTQIADAIRRDILFGRIQPGTKLSQQSICEEFDTSRMPVRDAFKQLTYEGLLRPESNGTVVARLRERDILDVYRVEGVLHGMATRRVAEEADDEELSPLFELHERMVAAEQHDDPGLMAALNWEFHRLVNKLSDSPKLIAAIRALSIQIPRDHLVQFPEWMSRTNEEHAEILAALSHKDADRAEELMRDHVETAGSKVLRYLRDIGVDLE